MMACPEVLHILLCAACSPGGLSGLRQINGGFPVIDGFGSLLRLCGEHVAHVALQCGSCRVRSRVALYCTTEPRRAAQSGHVQQRASGVRKKQMASLPAGHIERKDMINKRRLRQ